MGIKMVAIEGGFAFVTSAGRVEVRPADFPPGIRAQAELHGFNQKIRDTANQKGKTDAEQLEVMTAMKEQLMDGVWNRKGGGSGVLQEDLAHALAEVSGKADVDAMLAIVAKATPEQREKWSKNTKVAAILAQRKADRLKARLAGAEAVAESDSLADEIDELLS